MRRTRRGFTLLEVLLALLVLTAGLLGFVGTLASRLGSSVTVTDTLARVGAPDESNRS